jgi:hypothetical protein
MILTVVSVWVPPLLRERSIAESAKLPRPATRLVGEPGQSLGSGAYAITGSDGRELSDRWKDALFL